MDQQLRVFLAGAIEQAADQAQDEQRIAVARQFAAMVMNMDVAERARAMDVARTLHAAYALAPEDRPSE